MDGDFLWFLTHIAFETSMLLQYGYLAAGLLLLFYEPQKEKSRPWLRTAGCFVLLCAAELLAGALYWTFFGRTFMNMAMHAVVLVLAGVFFCRFRIRARLILGISFYAAEISINSIAGVFAKLLEEIEFSDFGRDLLRNVIILMTVLVAGYLRRRKSKDIRNQYLELERKNGALMF